MLIFYVFDRKQTVVCLDVVELQKKVAGYSLSQGECKVICVVEKIWHWF